MDRIYRNIYNAIFFGCKIGLFDIHSLYGFTKEDGYLIIPKLLFAYSIGDECYPVEFEVLSKKDKMGITYYINIYNVFIHGDYYSITMAKAYTGIDTLDRFYNKQPVVIIEKIYTNISTEYQIRDFGDSIDMVFIPNDPKKGIGIFLDQMIGRVIGEEGYSSIPSFPPMYLGRYKFNIEKQFENIALPIINEIDEQRE